MFCIRFDIYTVSSFYYLFLSVYGEFKLAACYICSLGMIVCMRCSDCTGFKLNLYKHYLSVIPHDLTNYTFACRFPCLFFF